MFGGGPEGERGLRVHARPRRKMRGMRENALEQRPMSLSDDEIERYARHLVLREVGGPASKNCVNPEC